MYYLIESTLAECSASECHSGKSQYAAILTPEEWQNEQADFEMGIDMELNVLEVHTTKAEVNYDSVTGTFALPSRESMSDGYIKFAFALDEKGIVFIDPGDNVLKITKKIAETRKWRIPSLERFLYDFLETVISEDLTLLEEYEKELDAIDRAVTDNQDVKLDRVYKIRGHLRILKTHYDRLIDLSQEFEENENNFFKTNNLRFFNLFTKRVSRLFEMTNSLLDYTRQIRENYESRLDDRQNHVITVLTIVTSIFMPLTLIAGWYGMNFRYMPELDSIYGYPAVIVISILIALSGLAFFKYKKWL